MAGLIWILLSACLLGCTSQVSLSGQKNVTAESGRNVTLTCQARKNIQTVEWRRADLGDQYVFLYRDGRETLVHQHPSFKDRVDLQDKQMKDGDVSLILNNVTINDTGTYECRVVETGTIGLKIISIIHLSVVDPPGSVGLIVGVVVTAAALVVAAVAGFVIYRNHKGKRSSSQTSCH
ncbi:selection and upkeep of intraepithelial T-cells protein 1-like [Simochromis diagramma]|uniref:selection and upkeep of intraepithelial T-cells protein 1-like n=1 Tax=Simochromis diagramma TaxID=43689 RepID=UPI001A7ECD0B|nr:selection and upkeep of intraepithelial T-cells protein 1-like [Simochromis diagramma]